MYLVKSKVKEWQGCHLAGNGLNEMRCLAEALIRLSVLFQLPCVLHQSVHLVFCDYSSFFRSN